MEEKTIDSQKAHRRRKNKDELLEDEAAIAEP